MRGECLLQCNSLQVLGHEVRSLPVEAGVAVPDAVVAVVHRLAVSIGFDEGIDEGDGLPKMNGTR